jgi:aureolysin
LRPIIHIGKFLSDFLFIDKPCYSLVHRWRRFMSLKRQFFLQAQPRGLKMSKQHYLFLALASVTLMLIVTVGNHLGRSATGSQEAAHQAVLDKQFELTKKSLLNPLPHKNTRSQSNKPLKTIAPTTTKSTAETTALVLQSIEEFAELFEVKPKTQSREAEHLGLDPLVKKELILLDNTFSADQPSKVVISKSGKLEAIYPSFEVPNILSKNLSSLNESTLKMIDSHPRLFGLNASASTKASKSNCGQKICNTTITKEFNGLPAWDHSLVVATNGKRIVSILGEFQPPNLSVTASNKLNRDQISSIIAAHFKIAANQVKITTAPQQGIGRVAGHDYIGYRVNVDLGAAGQYQVSINSRSKKVVEALSLVMTVSVDASGTTLNGDAVNFRADQQGSLYSLKDDRFPLGFTTSVYSAASGEWDTANLASSNAAESSWDPAAVTSIFNTELLMDYYSDNHNYQAINSTGRDLHIIVNALIDGSSENAFWQADLQLMVFGKGNGVSTGNYANSLDVHAHEMTHGVISSTSNLRYEFQSGALNEAFADFFGTQLDSEDWTLGEDIRLDGTPIRSLANPNLYNQPAHMSQYLYRSASEDHGGVHSNSGIPNRAMYLLSSGLSEENLGTSIGRAKAGQIVWETMTSLPSDASFEDAARQMIAIAGSLYGSESIEQTATEAAWAAVGVPQENLLLSTINLSASDVSAYNSMLYLSPMYDPSIVPPEENTFNLYAQYYANSSPAFSAQSNFGPLNSNPVQLTRPSQVMLQDGSYTTIYRSTNGDLFSYNSALGFEQVLDIGFNVSDITLSSDGQILVFSIEDAPLIYAYDYSTQSLTSIQVNGPDFSETDGIQGNVVFVDTLRFDPSSRRIVFDYLTCSYQVGSDCSQAEGVFFWSIGILDIDTQQINYPFPAQPASIDVGFPSFSNLTDQYITFDLIDYDASTESGIASYVIIYNQFERQFDVVGYPDTTDEQLGYYGMPSFSADDSGIAFASRDNGGASFLIYAELQDYDLSTDQSWLTLNPFFGYAPFSIPLIPFDRDPTLQLEASGIDFGGVLRGATHSQQLCANNTDLFPIRIMQLQDSSESMQWLGAGTLLSSGERMCGELTLDTSDWTEGSLSRTVSISHDGANSPTALSINAVISDDTDGDNILNYVDIDDDNDGVPDSNDEFPLDATESIDTDSDGVGNNGDPDDDNDGVIDDLDALPLDATEQIDTDADGIGNNVDNDDDNDEVADSNDAYPLNGLYSADSDGDGMPDAWETRYGLNPNDASDASSDQDKDGISAYDEFIAGTVPAGSLDIDGNGQYDALTDGLLLLRGMFLLSGDALISNAVASDAVYKTSDEVTSRIDMLGDLVDIDGNGTVDALTDGLVILRYLFNLRGDVLINDVIASDATVKTAEDVEAKIEQLIPAL